jgi:hypothetical protein
VHHEVVHLVLVEERVVRVHERTREEAVGANIKRCGSCGRSPADRQTDRQTDRDEATSIIFTLMHTYIERSIRQASGFFAITNAKLADACEC